MKKNNSSKYISITIALLLGVLLVAKLSLPKVLRLYVESGVGNCQQIPILCMSPEERIVNPQIDTDYLKTLYSYKLDEVGIALPKDFAVVKENIKKVYYKKRKFIHSEAIAYLLYKEPDFFVNLFPRLKRQGIASNYEFLKETMCARLSNVKNLQDTFFMIMKGIFIPDLGEAGGVRMLEVELGERQGFINYNTGAQVSYFDCNLIDREGDFFKIYIRDKGSSLNLNKVIAIISTVRKIK